MPNCSCCACHALVGNRTDGRGDLEPFRELEINGQQKTKTSKFYIKLLHENTRHKHVTSTYPSISTNSGSSFPFSFLWFGSEKAELAADTQLKPGVDARDLEKIRHQIRTLLGQISIRIVSPGVRLG